MRLMGDLNSCVKFERAIQREKKEKGRFEQPAFWNM
jgi:hypothetical protein